MFSSDLPTSNGTYKITEDGNGANEVSIVATEVSTMGVYVVQSGTLKVTVNDGKVILDLDPANAKYEGMTSKPDAMVSMHIAQP